MNPNVVLCFTITVYYLSFLFLTKYRAISTATTTRQGISTAIIPTIETQNGNNTYNRDTKYIVLRH